MATWPCKWQVSNHFSAAAHDPSFSLTLHISSQKLAVSCLILQLTLILPPPANHSRHHFAGVFVASSFLSSASPVWAVLPRRASNFPPLRMSHGSADSLVPMVWGASTHAALLAALGANADVRFVCYDGVEHELVAEELQAFEDFVLSSITSATEP